MDVVIRMLGILRAVLCPKGPPIDWVFPDFFNGGNCLKFSPTTQSKLFHGKYRENSLYSLTADRKRFFSNLPKSEIKFMVKGSCINKALDFLHFFQCSNQNMKAQTKRGFMFYLPGQRSEALQRRRPCQCPGDCPGRSGGRRRTGETCRTRSWTCRRWWRGSPPGWSLTLRRTSQARTLILCLQFLTGMLPPCRQSCQQPLLDFEPDVKIQRIFILYSKFLWTS